MKARYTILTVTVVVLAILAGAFGTVAQASQGQIDSASTWQGDFSGHTMVLGYAEIVTDPLSGEAGGITYFRSDLGNGQLAHDFVYNDPRRAQINGGNPGITYGIKYSNTSSDSNLTSQAHWLKESIEIWNRQACANLTLSERTISGAPGLVENYFAGGGINLGLVEADLTQVGFRGAGAIFAPGTNVLGVTYTLFWADANGQLTDIDNNGKIDVALREIYYNDQYNWSDNGVEGFQPDGSRWFDFPTVAIHESGHGLSAAHFGNIGRKDGLLIANPRSIMNAIYGGTLRNLEGRDVASVCSNWSQWPHR